MSFNGLQAELVENRKCQEGGGGVAAGRRKKGGLNGQLISHGELSSADDGFVNHFRLNFNCRNKSLLRIRMRERGKEGVDGQRMKATSFIECLEVTRRSIIINVNFRKNSFGPNLFVVEMEEMKCENRRGSLFLGKIHKTY